VPLLWHMRGVVFAREHTTSSTPRAQARRGQAHKRGKQPEVGTRRHRRCGQVRACHVRQTAPWVSNQQSRRRKTARDLRLLLPPGDLSGGSAK